MHSRFVWETSRKGQTEWNKTFPQSSAMSLDFRRNSPVSCGVTKDKISKGLREAVTLAPFVCLRELEKAVLGEGKWGHTKYRHIPESEGDWKGRAPKCSLARKTL